MSVVDMTDGRVDLGGRTIWAEATFALAAGSITAVLGPNGAGKTTLLNSLLGLVPLSGGSLRVLGDAPRRGHRGVGYMAQSRVADQQSTLRARDYVALAHDGVRYGWRRGPGRDAAVDRALGVTGSLAFADRPLRTLSGGQRQRVALAAAVVFEPALLLLDEPLAGLDLAAQAEIVDLVNLLRDSTGATVVVVAHDLNPLAPIVDHVAWIARRRVRFGTIDDVVNEATLSDLYGHPIEIVVTASGRRVIVGLEEEFAHPHPHGHEHGGEDPHVHLDEVYPGGEA